LLWTGPFTQSKSARLIPTLIFFTGFGTARIKDAKTDQMVPPQPFVSARFSPLSVATLYEREW
jgi:hypothetical protein